MGDAEYVMGTNALGTLNANEAFTQAAGEGSAIVNVASMAAHMPPERLIPAQQFPLALTDEDRFMDEMLATMYAADGLGLAAVQVGVPRRMITIDVARREDENAPRAPIFLINPELLWTSDDTAVHGEGCLSIPEYYADVERPARVRVAYLDRNGEKQEIEANGILAVCLQHEIDHLHGKLFIDYLSKLKRDMVVKKFTKQAKLAPKPAII